MGNIDRAVVIAGGCGKRLWPWAGPSLPKPLLPLGGGGRTLLAATIDRISRLIPIEAVRVQSPSALGETLLAAESRLSRRSLWSEPSARDTAPAIALAMRRLLDEQPDAICAVLPADHRVERADLFCEALQLAAEAAELDRLDVLGVRPDQPSSQFGHLESGEHEPGLPERACAVARFVEKPDAEHARRLFDSGRYLWNAGIFVWRAAAFWDQLERRAPQVARPVDDFVRDGSQARWEKAEKTSIDYALMEKAHNVAMVPLAAGWDDIGGWETVSRLVDRGDAGPVVRLPVAGGADAASEVLWVCTEQGPPGPAPERAIAVPDTPSLVVVGPGGVLVTPHGASARAKPFA
ncbi:MAG: NTP transferase domain-containing protein [Acidobacteriota bacterium]|nr:MAG: NTP transferase domain-containing protein [Acidobacteriota bacterium]